MAQNPNTLDTARRVVRTEAAALGTLANALDASLTQAVDLILAATGRVIVSGMGKSGHIARKIAATLASTGTPAHFVHPAEASHGDLGMMTAGDVVIVLSNSGETPELADLIAHTRRFGIPMIGMASVATSTLMVQADVALVLPQVQEACGTGVVPTTTTTMSLALGDAIAIALMEHRDFTATQFRDFHPGGKLGARLSKVADLMHAYPAIPCVAPDCAMGDALITMTESGFGVAAVVDGGDKLLGIITDGDLRRNMDGLLDRTASDVMTANPITVSDTILAEAALSLMHENKVTCLFVCDANSKVLGLLHIHDCLRAGLA